MLPLRSDRLVLRPFVAEDVASFFAYRSDPEVARYQNWESGDLAGAATFLESQRDGSAAAPGQWRQIAIALAENNTLIGDCALKLLEPDARQATMGIT